MQQADTFAAFVAVLAEALDDHDATAADLAGRHHLSRSHLDRVVAAGGERPGAFRRRRVTSTSIRLAAFGCRAGTR